MNRKIKITYLNYGTVKAVIDNCQGIWDIHNVCNRNSIYDNDILKIEWILEAESFNTFDNTTVIR